MRLLNIIFFISSLLFVGCATNEPAHPFPRAAFPEPGIYKVQAGDNAALIAKKLCLTVEQLLAINPGIDWTRLKIGQRLHYAPPPGN